MSFIEQLISRKFNLSQEVQSIHKLMNECSPYSSSAYSMIKENFRQWKHRNNYIDLEQLFESEGLNAIIQESKNNLVNKESFIYFSESIINLLRLAYTEGGYSNCKNFSIILQNITNVLNQLNYKIVQIESEDYYKIIEDDWKVSAAAEIISDKYNLGEKIYIYGHYSLKGKLYDKADILCRLYKVFEGKLESKLKANNYSALASDIGFLSDKLDVRHAPDKKQKILLEGFSSEEQEQWYDDLFSLYLDALILCEHIDKRKDVKELRKKLSDIKP